MIELVLHSHLDEISCERLPSGTVRVHLAMHHSSQDIADQLQGILTDDLLSEAQSLFAEDNRNRKFHYEGDYLVVSPA